MTLVTAISCARYKAVVGPDPFDIPEEYGDDWVNLGIIFVFVICNFAVLISIIWWIMKLLVEHEI